MPNDRQIGTARNLEELQALLRGRFQELGYSCETIEDLAGLTTHYATKLFSTIPSKLIGPLKFGPILRAAAVKLVVVEDPEALSSRADSRVKREEGKVTAHSARSGGTTRADIERMTRRSLRRQMRENARKGGKATADSLSPEQRQASASNAAKRRWQQWRRKRAERRKRRPPEPKE